MILCGRIWQRRRDPSVAYRKKLGRGKLLSFLASQPSFQSDSLPLLDIPVIV